MASPMREKLMATMNALARARGGANQIYYGHLSRVVSRTATKGLWIRPPPPLVAVGVTDRDERLPADRCQV